MFDVIPLWTPMRKEAPEIGAAFLADADLPYTGARFRRMALAWAFVLRWWSTFQVPDVDTIPTLDELARRIFAAADVPAHPS